MLKIRVGKNESIDKAVKRYKRKYDSTKMSREIRDRREFKKKSVKKREEKQKAIFIRKKYGED